ncbi:cation-translocating P-type ATPase [Streptomyces sp. NPDC088732]|uniref:cation-translocating P-type ATPase n=1 Tax=Streptomyces sp. NPDC088732 TaxID=3365879 RepID=UPI0037FAE76F
MHGGTTEGATATGHRGLSQREANELLALHGPNQVSPKPPPALWRRAFQQLRDPLIVVLLAAAALTLATGDLPDAGVILLVITVNTTVGVAQEVRAEHAVAALTALSAPSARVVRDGTELRIPSADVVPGDAVLLGEGDIVPADGEVTEAAALLVDESSLTGESVPVEKGPGQEGGTARAGTVVVRGRGRMLVTATGEASAIGRIASLLAATPGLTPLQRRLAGFGRALAAVIVVLCAVVLALGLLRGQPVELMVVAAISLAVAAVPESLPAVVTLGLGLGARRMAARRAIVRHLPAVETLGSVTVLATDKTGTLTEGSMAVERLWTPVGEAEVRGSGYDPAGQVLRDGNPVGPDEAPDLANLLRAAMLCNDASLEPPCGRDEDIAWHALGDPTEAALLVAGGRLGLDRSDLGRWSPRVAEVPFDSSRKRMTTVHGRSEGGLLVVSKGAPEVMIRPEVLHDGARLRDTAAERAEQLARDGYRVLAVATAVRPRTGGTTTAVWEDDSMSLLGLVAILDPPRPGAAAAVAACRDAGIKPILITGDHPLTARAVATRLGITGPAAGDEATSGEHRGAAMTDLTAARVHARTTPEQKLGIIQAWQAAGHVVAMTGDGVNDGPALRQADIGVAMGRRGTEVARQAADLVLSDDDLGTVVAAVEEGRRVYANVRRFLLYGLCGAVPRSS